ncbi:hypothetical protein BY996DRAFT_6411432 [Phakopsora pachyrhizi]|nr:hypothetical protein BY996DRAFT_6411432 [Phakopsora pachyrhizi]
MILRFSPRVWLSNQQQIISLSPALLIVNYYRRSKPLFTPFSTQPEVGKSFRCLLTETSQSGKSYSTISTTTLNGARSVEEKVDESYEFDEEVEREIQKLPALKAQETRRRLRNERRAENSGHSLSRQDVLIIPYIPPYDGPNSNANKGLWTHLKIGWKKDQLKEAWGQWLGSRQARKNVHSILSPGNRNWENDFKSEALDSIVLLNHSMTTGNYEDEELKRYLHPQMIKYMRSKREDLLRVYNPSYSITWKKHELDSDGGQKKQLSDKELEIVAMRAAPIDKGSMVVQIAVRFISSQSVEIRDERGFLVFGSHENPTKTIEYFVFQRKMGGIGTPFQLFTKVEENQKPDCLPV